MSEIFHSDIDEDANEEFDPFNPTTASEHPPPPIIEEFKED